MILKSYVPGWYAFWTQTSNIRLTNYSWIADLSNVNITPVHDERNTWRSECCKNPHINMSIQPAYFVTKLISVVLFVRHRPSYNNVTHPCAMKPISWCPQELPMRSVSMMKQTDTDLPMSTNLGIVFSVTPNSPAGKTLVGCHRCCCSLWRENPQCMSAYGKHVANVPGICQL